MDMGDLYLELSRLECEVRWRGRFGFIFVPRESGGLNIEYGQLHFWDCCVNADFDLDVAAEALRQLPDGAGYAGVLDALTKLAGVEIPLHCDSAQKARQGGKSSSVVH